MKKEILKNALLGMSLSRKESETIKGGVAVGGSVGSYGSAKVACFCLPGCTECVSNSCTGCTGDCQNSTAWIMK